MPLQIGSHIGSYEIVGALGAGGMGEVYRARDTRLKRDVAIKVLPEIFSHDPDRLARFQREAELLAALNHPNIAAVYGLEAPEPTATGPALHAIVMELVEGDTLAEVIARGPMAVADALPVARQVAEALEAAHEKGVIHRDLKPANIKVTPDGIVKVLDFGLGKLLEPQAAASSLTMSPTLSVHATRQGVILGTAAYMSPEQAKGRAADKRSDVWAFGCVLYEMLTGATPFAAEDLSTTLAAVIMKEPDWSPIPAGVPPAIRTLVQRCLEKDRRKRIADLSTAIFLIEEQSIGAVPAAGVVAPSTATQVPSNLARRGPWLVAGVALAAFVGVLFVWKPWRTTSPPSPVRLEVSLGADASLVGNQGASAVLSPDGRTLAFTAQKGGVTQIYVRRLDQLRAVALSGTEEASSPFFKPDGQWIAFFAAGKLKKIAVTGGAAVGLCDIDTGNQRGGAWGDDGTIVFQPIGANGGYLMRVPDAGGKPEPLTKLASGEVTQRWPQVLPGGKAVIFTSHATTGSGYEDANIVVQPLPDGPRKILQRGGYYGRYLASGHLAYLHDGTLFVAPFDLDRLDVTGQPVPAIEGVASQTGNGGAHFAVADNGTIVYLPGRGGGLDAPISWLDRAGKPSLLRATPADWSNPRFAPDGQRLAVDVQTSGNTDVWVYEWARDVPTRLTFEPGPDRNPVWTPDGRRIAFASQPRPDPNQNIYWKRADGTGDMQRLTNGPNAQVPVSWHPSGKYLAFYESNLMTGNDLMILPIEGDEASGWKPGKPTPFLNTPANEREAAFSPDGRWLAYESTESGRYEVYVRPFPGPGGKWQVSTNGGLTPTWSRTRRELFFLGQDQRIMVAQYSVEGQSFRVDKPSLLSEATLTTTARNPRSYDLHPDGQRFAVSIGPNASTAAQRDKVVVVFNFFDELRRLTSRK
jgi:serine/threonine-protein kinase